MGKGSKAPTAKSLGKKVKAVVLENRNVLAYAVAVIMAAIIGFVFFFGVYVMNNPASMDETFVDQVWWPWILAGLFLAAGGLLISLPFGKGYPAWRVGFMFFFALVGVVLLIWWYVLHPALFEVPELQL